MLLSAGSNAHGQLSNGSDDDSHVLRPCSFEGGDVPAGRRLADLAFGANHTLALLEDAESGKAALWGCGDGRKGSAGSGVRAYDCFESPSVFRSNLMDSLRIPRASSPLLGKLPTSSSPHQSAQTSSTTSWSFWAWAGGADDVVVGWGASRHGQLGDAKKPFAAAPAVIRRGISRSIALGHQHTVVLDSSGGLVAFGSNRKQQLDGLDGLHARSVHCTWNGTYVVTTEGHLLSTGSNIHGQLGRDTNTCIDHVAFPFNAATHDLVQLACGSEHVLAVFRTPQSALEVWGWGWNEHGNLGSGSTEDAHMPRKLWPSDSAPTIPGSENVSAPAASLPVSMQAVRWPLSGAPQAPSTPLTSTTRTTAKMAVLATCLNTLTMIDVLPFRFSLLIDTLYSPANPRVTMMHRASVRLRVMQRGQMRRGSAKWFRVDAAEGRSSVASSSAVTLESVPFGSVFSSATAEPLAATDASSLKPSVTTVIPVPTAKPKAAAGSDVITLPDSDTLQSDDVQPTDAETIILNTTTAASRSGVLASPIVPVITGTQTIDIISSTFISSPHAQTTVLPVAGAGPVSGGASNTNQGAGDDSGTVEVPTTTPSSASASTGSVSQERNIAVADGPNSPSKAGSFGSFSGSTAPLPFNTALPALSGGQSDSVVQPSGTNSLTTGVTGTDGLFTPTATPPETTTIDGGNPLSSSSSRNKSNIAGAAIGASVALLIGGALAVFLFRRCRRRHQRATKPCISSPLLQTGAFYPDDAYSPITRRSRRTSAADAPAMVQVASDSQSRQLNQGFLVLKAGRQRVLKLSELVGA
ncbi:RCC1/BLIP-II proteni [Mycena kentingensis (nom. inval.)]|nr:RCC1/BLIP-II proteni [Mycena kentingensis (nom. inval.)]